MMSHRVLLQPFEGAEAAPFECAQLSGVNPLDRPVFPCAVARRAGLGRGCRSWEGSRIEERMGCRVALVMTSQASSRRRSMGSEEVAQGGHRADSGLKRQCVGGAGMALGAIATIAWET